MDLSTPRSRSNRDPETGNLSQASSRSSSPGEWEYRITYFDVDESSNDAMAMPSEEANRVHEQEMAAMQSQLDALTEQLEAEKAARADETRYGKIEHQRMVEQVRYIERLSIKRQGQLNLREKAISKQKATKENYRREFLNLHKRFSNYKGNLYQVTSSAFKECIIKCSDAVDEGDAEGNVPMDEDDANLTADNQGGQQHDGVNGA